jgi:hypothetical protein
MCRGEEGADSMLVVRPCYQAVKYIWQGPFNQQEQTGALPCLQRNCNCGHANP